MTWGSRPRQGSIQGRRSRRRSAGLQRAAADLQVPLGSLRGQQRLRRRDPRRSQRRLGPDGRRHAGHRKCVLGDAAHAHRVFPRLHRGQGGSPAAGGGRNHYRIMRRCWSGTARSSRKCSTASPWISAAPRNTACLPRSFCPISGRRPDFSPALLEKMFEMGRHWFILNSGKYPSIAAEVNCHHQPANGGRGAGRPAGRHGGLLQLDGEPGPGLPGQRQKHFRLSRRLVSPLSRQGDRRQFLLHQQRHGLALLDFRRRLARAPVLGPLPGHRRPGFPPQPRRAGLQRAGAFLRGFPDTATDKNGNYMFAPSFSPENMPASTDPSGPVLVNATMDIAVCREVLTNLIQASRSWAPTPTAWRNGRRCWPRCRPICSNWTAP